MELASSPRTPDSKRPKLEEGNSEAIQRYWPESAITEILSRLPVKSILKFKSVRKSWYSLIRSRFFVDFHRSHHDGDDHRNQLFFSRLGKHNVDALTTDFFSFSKFDVGVLLEALTGLTFDEIWHTIGRTNFYIPRQSIRKVLEPNMKVLGPLSNGIYCVVAEITVLVAIESTGGFFNAAICNPATREFKLIRPPNCPLYENHKRYYGFCSLQASDGVVVDYKIVVISQLVKEIFRASQKIQVFVYSLRLDSWTEYTWFEFGGYNKHQRRSRKALAAFMHNGNVQFPRITQDLDFLPHAFVNGSCHWMAEHSVVQLDMTKEIFGLIAGPPMDYRNLPDSLMVKRGVFAFNDHLFAMFIICEPILGVRIDHEINVWMMMEYGVAKSWTKIHSGKFQLEGELEKFLGMFFSKESHGIERMFFQDKQGIFVSYDCSTCIIRTTEKDGTCDSSWICWKTIGLSEYHETLEPVSLEASVKENQADIKLEI